MNHWKVIYSNQARLDLLNIDGYIRYKLFAPESANRVTDKIMYEINQLDIMPNRYSLYRENPWHNLGLRFFPVANYLIFYHPEEQTRTVQIIRIMYSGQDSSKHLPTNLNE